MVRYRRNLVPIPDLEDRYKMLWTHFLGWKEEEGGLWRREDLSRRMGRGIGQRARSARRSHEGRGGGASGLGCVRNPRGVPRS